MTWHDMTLRNNDTSFLAALASYWRCSGSNWIGLDWITWYYIMQLFSISICREITFMTPAAAGGGCDARIPTASQWRRAAAPCFFNVFYRPRKINKRETYMYIYIYLFIHQEWWWTNSAQYSQKKKKKCTFNQPLVDGEKKCMKQKQQQQKKLHGHNYCILTNIWNKSQ